MPVSANRAIREQQSHLASSVLQTFLKTSPWPSLELFSSRTRTHLAERRALDYTVRRLAVMNFQSSSRQPSTTNPYAAAPGPVYGGNSSGTRLLKRLFKFGQMDFELALWEISSLMLAPKKVFKNMYYNVGLLPSDMDIECHRHANTRDRNVRRTTARMLRVFSDAPANRNTQHVHNL